MDRVALLQGRKDVVKTRSEARRKREINDKIRARNEREKIKAETSKKEPNLKKTLELRPVYDRIDELVALEEAILTTNVGVYHPTVLCRDVSHTRCDKPVRWHTGLKRYALCGDEQCPNYYLCTSCGKEFGKHVI